MLSDLTIEMLTAFAVMNSTIGCGLNADDVFGPQVEPCVRSFDFTLLFENTFLSAAPSALFLLIVPIRLYYLRNARKRVTGGSAFQVLKLVSQLGQLLSETMLRSNHSSQLHCLALCNLVC